jgi:hypothetical protein
VRPATDFKIIRLARVQFEFETPVLEIYLDLPRRNNKEVKKIKQEFRNFHTGLIL